MNPTIRSPGQGRTVAIVGDVYRFLAIGDDMNGKYAIWEADVPRGGGPTPHIHSREEEAFYVLEGEITIHVGDERIVAKAGMFANMPVGSFHSFKKEKNQTTKMLTSVATEGPERCSWNAAVLLAEGTATALPLTKEEIERLVAVAHRFGIDFSLPSDLR